MILELGSKGPIVKILQQGLASRGFWPEGVDFSENYGPKTEQAVRDYQNAKGLVPDGEAGPKVFTALGINVEEYVAAPLHKYKDVIFEGSVFPDVPVRNDLKIVLNKEMREEYLPTLDKTIVNQPRGFKLLMTIMAHKEGFYKKGPQHRESSRSYAHNNPGNIGNTDSGKNLTKANLSQGILLQQTYILGVINGHNTLFPMGKIKKIPPYYSPEIAKNQKTYGIDPYLPGYNFIFTGQLDQFVKIYSTGPRAGNGYLSMIRSYFKQNGLDITGSSKIQDIIAMV
jgi:peptidoglycan hydrolase-like protein with peptidoglycan-binding domain